MRIFNCEARNVRPFDLLDEGRVVIQLQIRTMDPGVVYITDSDLHIETEDVQLPDGQTITFKRPRYHNTQERTFKLTDRLRVARYDDSSSPCGSYDIFASQRGRRDTGRP